MINKIAARDFIDKEIGVDYKLLSMNNVLKDLHCHDYWEFFVVIDGSVIHNINEEKVKLSTGQMVFIRPNDIHNYSNYNDTECMFINIAIESHIVHKLSEYLDISIEKMFLQNVMPPTMRIKESEVEKFYNDFLKLQTIPAENLREKKCFVFTMIFNMITKFITDNGKTEQNKLMPDWFNYLLQIMNKPENIQDGMDALIKVSGFSHGYLCRVFKQNLDMTPVQYITQLRLSYSANLLSTTDISIIDIANRAGYSSGSHFIKAFKNQYGILPSKYRNKFYFKV